jgi:NAD(P)-dependent dehydrogenase (short-subunit alcohol dehydrogenase family)
MNVRNDKEVAVDSFVNSRVVAISGAGRGIGRAHALALSAAGSKVVINDLISPDGENPAEALAAEIRADGGTAIAHHDDVSTEDGARSLIDLAIAEFGSIDVLVNNAGIVRDAMIFNMTPAAWDAVIAVHLRSTFLTTSYVTGLWREQSKAGQHVDGRIINTTSVAGLYGNIGQANYVAAKAGIAAFTIAVAREVERYGVVVNAISPGATTRMTESLMDASAAAALAPEHVAKVAVWLASDDATGITGRVFHSAGRELAVPDGWSVARGELAPDGASPAEVGGILHRLLAEARPAALMDGSIPEAVR